jgi:hypothetical protein
MRDVEAVVRQLIQVPVALATAAQRLPSEAGFYAWWTKKDSIPGVPECPHPTEKDLHLFYVGIAPSRPTSSATIRSRVINNHIRGNTGSSTFRLTLASLLLESENYERVRATDRVLLTAQDNRRLTKWQEENLFLTWAEHPRPWEIEHEVIAALKPPLNLAGNQSHPFWRTLSDARKRFKDVEETRRSITHAPAPSNRRSQRRRESVTLHEEIEAILRENGGDWMTTRQIAEAVARRGRYIKKDGTSDVSAFQVHGRTKNYPQLFERDGSKVRLKQG